MTDTPKAPEKLKKKASRGVGCLVSVLLIVGIVAFLVSRMPQCGKNSKQAAMARSLSQERLAQLYHQMRKLRESPVDDGSKYAGYSGHAIPLEFRDLNCKTCDLGILHPTSCLRGVLIILWISGVTESESQRMLATILLELLFNMVNLSSSKKSCGDLKEMNKANKS